MSRAIVVVDLETTALQPRTLRAVQNGGGHLGVVVECSWWNLTTGEAATFVPAHDPDEVLAYGHPDALDKNGYRDRLANAEQSDSRAWTRLLDQVQGQTMAGSNPAFDLTWTRVATTGIGTPTPHHRLLDVSAYAAGVWGLPGSELPGLREVCERLGIVLPDHTAAGDVRAGGQALIALGAVPGVSS